MFWLAARLLVAAGLLVAALRPWQPMLETRHRYRLLVGVVAYVALLYALELLTPDHLPAFFVPGSGLTPLRWRSNTGRPHLRRRGTGVRLAGGARGGLQCRRSLRCVGGGDALRTVLHPRYVSVSDNYFIGHLYKIISYGFIYRAVFVESVRQPFQALSRALDNEKHWAARTASLVRTLDMLEEAVIELSPDGTIINANSGWWQPCRAPAPTRFSTPSTGRSGRFRGLPQKSPTARRTEFTAASASSAATPTNAGWSAVSSPN